MRPALILVRSASALSLALVAVSASAEGAHPGDGCPPGDWFCEPPSASPAAPEATPPHDDSPDEASDEPPPPAGRPGWRHERRHRHRLQLEPEDFPPPPPRPRHRFDRWGFGVHAFGALLGSNRHMPSDASMGGLGLTLRYRAMPEFGFEATGEFGFGTDYNGHERDEAALLLNAVGFLNPRSPVRIYAIGGLGLSSAHVVYQTAVVNYSSGGSSIADGDDHFSYVGFDAGAGVEIELSPHSALHADLLGFVRDRTDSGRNSAPEFVDPATGRTTNSSGGGLLRVGAMFSW